MKIALYVGELDIKGGTHKQVLRLAQHLCEMGHELQILTPTYVAAKTYEEFTSLPVNALYSASEGAVNWRVRMRAKLSPIRLAWSMPKVDVLNIHDNRGVIFFFAATLLRKARCTAWQINDLHPAFKIGANSASSPARIFDRVHIAANRWMARRVDAILVNVRKNVGRVSKHLGRPALLFHCGVDLPDASPAPLRPGVGSYRLLTTGVFFAYRNYEKLIAGTSKAQIALKRPIELTIVGDTRYQPDYVEKVRNCAINEGVALRVRENLSQDELDVEIANNHVFAFVNLDQSWGLSVFEAAARGKPVVLSDSVGACELLAGHSGFMMCDANNVQSIERALVQLLADPDQCVAVAKSAQQHVRTMSWASMYCKPVELLFQQLRHDVVTRH